MKKIILTFTSVFVYSICLANSLLFSTWEGFEADKLASMWLIKRFIAPDAEIILYPRNQTIDKGIQFDTPYSQIRRTFNQSTFESFLTHYRLSDRKLSNIAKLIHDIEINVWENKVFKKTREMEIFFLELLNGNQDHASIIKQSYEYFDRLYNELPDELK